MDFRVEWKEILMILGTGAGGILSVLIFSITDEDLSFILFPFFLIGGWIIGWILEKIS